nr:immunoglobulin light chain junction region [Macaca mulatta]MOX76257.1 immunoglobulin light chain junction region [Macaca mulatta]
DYYCLIWHDNSGFF